jgi:hypothetical protein
MAQRVGLPVAQLSPPEDSSPEPPEGALSAARRTRAPKTQGVASRPSTALSVTQCLPAAQDLHELAAHVHAAGLAVLRHVRPPPSRASTHQQNSLHKVNVRPLKRHHFPKTQAGPR